jgi:hypothetical protein
VTSVKLRRAGRVTYYVLPSLCDGETRAEEVKAKLMPHQLTEDNKLTYTWQQ